MKKLFLLIGLLTMFIFLVSCTDNIAGEAFKFKALQPKCVKEMCDNKDNDCDGIVDDGVKNCCRGVSTPLDTAANCGSCGNVCKSGQSCLNGACVAPTTFSCTGTVPANSTLCTGDDASLSANTVRTTVAACTVAKCEYTCNTGYNLQNGVCVQRQCVGTETDRGYRGNNPDWPCCPGRELKPGNPSSSMTSCCLPQDCGYDNVCFANRYNASWGNCNNGVWSVPVAAPTNFCYYVASNGTQMPAGTGNYVFYNYSAASYQYRGVVTESGPLQNVCSPTNSGNTVRQICTNNTRGFDGYSSGLNWSVTTTESLCRVGGCNPSTGNCCVERSVESSCQGNTLTNSTYTDCSAEPITRVIDCSTTLSFLNRAGVCETRGTRTGCFTPRCTPGETANTCGSYGNYIYTCASDGLRWSYTGGGSGCTAGQSCQNGACVAPTTFS